MSSAVWSRDPQGGCCCLFLFSSLPCMTPLGTWSPPPLPRRVGLAGKLSFRGRGSASTLCNGHGGAQPWVLGGCPLVPAAKANLIPLFVCSITAGPVGRSFVESALPSTPPSLSLALRRRCGCVSPATSTSTSQCLQGVLHRMWVGAARAGGWHGAGLLEQGRLRALEPL